MRKAEAVNPRKTMGVDPVWRGRHACAMHGRMEVGQCQQGWRRGDTLLLLLSRLSTLAQVANMRASDSLFSCKEEATYAPIQSWLLTEDIKNL